MWATRYDLNRETADGRRALPFVATTKAQVWLPSAVVRRSSSHNLTHVHHVDAAKAFVERVEGDVVPRGIPTRMEVAADLAAVVGQPGETADVNARVGLGVVEDEIVQQRLRVGIVVGQNPALVPAGDVAAMAVLFNLRRDEFGVVGLVRHQVIMPFLGAVLAPAQDVVVIAPVGMGYAPALVEKIDVASVGCAGVEPAPPAAAANLPAMEEHHARAARIDHDVVEPVQPDAHGRVGVVVAAAGEGSDEFRPAGFEVNVIEAVLVAGRDALPRVGDVGIAIAGPAGVDAGEIDAEGEAAVSADGVDGRVQIAQLAGCDVANAGKGLIGVADVIDDLSIRRGSEPVFVGRHLPVPRGRVIEGNPLVAVLQINETDLGLIRAGVGPVHEGRMHGKVITPVGADRQPVVVAEEEVAVPRCDAAGCDVLLDVFHGHASSGVSQTI